MNRSTGQNRERRRGGGSMADWIRSGGGWALSVVLLAGGFVAVDASESTIDDFRPVVFPVCYDFTCKREEVVTLSPSHWQSILDLFDEPAATPHEERLIIQKAIGRMEQLSGFHTPTYRDLARNYTGEDKRLAELPGQMDCVDESINTTTYLELFERRGLLAHHRVVERAYRRALLNQHWAGQVEEYESGRRYVVDSWFFDNGELPYVIASDEWHDISPFRRVRAQHAAGRAEERLAARRGR